MIARANTPHYNFIGFLPPIGTAGHTDPKGFKLGSTIPVKFQLVDDDENYVSNAIVTLWYGMGSNNARAGDFRYDIEGQQYVFNLDRFAWFRNLDALRKA